MSGVRKADGMREPALSRHACPKFVDEGKTFGMVRPLPRFIGTLAVNVHTAGMPNSMCSHGLKLYHLHIPAEDSVILLENRQGRSA
jgi:hypothetical protein